MAKYTLHVPVEQFGFVEAEIEVNGESAAEQAKSAYNAIKREWEGSTGIPEKEMNQVVDAMLSGEGVKDGVEIYNRMSDSQKETTQIIKRALKRINRRNGVEDTE